MSRSEDEPDEYDNPPEHETEEDATGDAGFLEPGAVAILFQEGLPVMAHRAQARTCPGCGRVPYPEGAGPLWACPRCCDTIGGALGRAMLRRLLSS